MPQKLLTVILLCVSWVSYAHSESPQQHCLQPVASIKFCSSELRFEEPDFEKIWFLDANDRKYFLMLFAEELKISPIEMSADDKLDLAQSELVGTLSRPGISFEVYQKTAYDRSIVRALATNGKDDDPNSIIASLVFLETGYIIVASVALASSDLQAAEVAHEHLLMTAEIVESEVPKR